MQGQLITHVKSSIDQITQNLIKCYLNYGLLDLKHVVRQDINAKEQLRRYIRVKDAKVCQQTTEELHYSVVLVN